MPRRGKLEAVWEEELDRARARADAFDAAAELEEARARAVRWRHVTSLSTFFLPLPLIARDILRWTGEWREAAEEDRFVDLVGLDERDRPLVHLLDPGSEWERPSQLWRYDETGFEEVELHGDATVRLVTLVDERPVRVITASSHGDRGVRLIRWEGGRPVRVEGARAYGSESALPEARAAVYDAAGALERVLRASGEEVDRIAEALARAAALTPATPVWDGRTRRPEPWPDDAHAMVEPLAAALDAALREAGARSGVDEPFLLEVRNGPGEFEGRPPFPPFAWLAGRAFRDRMRRASGYDETARHHLWKGVEAGDVAELDLVEVLDPAALRWCRALSTALAVGARQARRALAGDLAAAVGDRLAELLTAADWPGATDPFLALVVAGHPHRDKDAVALDRARRAIGDARVEAFLASIASGSPARDEERIDALAEAALTDRAALEELLCAHGLDAHAGRLAHEVAEDGLLLEALPAGAPAPRSRLGGPPLLPPDEPWPAGAHGRPLTFLAGIDLAELPPSQVAARLPDAGWLLFFAAIDPDEDGGEMVGESDTGARVLHVPPGAGPVPAEPRGDPLRDRPVAMRRVLTLPDGYESARELGLDVYEEETYEEACESLYGALDAKHWVGGLVTGVQGEAPDEGTVLLLHIAFDEQLGFPFLDGGAIQFRIAADHLDVRDFSRAFADADSC